jgi:hypothetical protein
VVVVDALPPMVELVVPVTTVEVVVLPRWSWTSSC